jgi:hypothetical protein
MQADTLSIILTQGLVIWVMVAGFAYILRGPRLAAVVVMWPIRTTLRLVRRGVGSLFVALGNWIRR